jgi:SAM-dependent methyltransferase
VFGDRESDMFEQLEAINARPAPFQFYTAEALWNDPYTSSKMLECHLNPNIDVSSRRAEFIDRSVEWIVDRFGVRSGTRIADFGCGPGLYTSRLAATGADVTGIDFSARSIRYARESAAQRGLPIDYVQQNYLEYTTEKRFDLITMIFCDYCALSPAQRLALRGRWRELLVNGGAVLLDVYTMHAYAQRREARTYQLNRSNDFWSPGRHYRFLTTFKYDEERVALDKYTIIEPARTRVVYNWLQYFDEESLRREFEGNGFEVAGLYADVAGASLTPDAPEMAIVARIA